MKNEAPYYITKLNDVYRSKKAKNPAYSLRAFARDLGIHSSSLSAILKNKRPLPAAALNCLTNNFNLSRAENDRVKKSAQTEVARTTIAGSVYARVLRSWEHFAILSLMDSIDFKSDQKWIGMRLGITPKRARECLAHLEACGLIRRDASNSFVKTEFNTNTSEDVPSSALVAGHLAEIDIARRQIKRISADLRDYSSVSLCIAPQMLPKAKRMIREFRKMLIQELEATPGSEVYMACIQMFPVSTLKHKAKREIK
ncbi:MAG: DUF4423 domain-containing protein [Bdellovibrionales bacterium]|nr:DUF4423 domain-containing protein [Bdellovibrionales bacterium]